MASTKELQDQINEGADAPSNQVKQWMLQLQVSTVSMSESISNSMLPQ